MATTQELAAVCAKVGAALAIALPCGPWSWKQDEIDSFGPGRCGMLTRAKDAMSLRLGIHDRMGRGSITASVSPDFGRDPVTGAWRGLRECLGRHEAPSLDASFAASRCDDPKTLGVVAGEIKRKVIVPWTELLPAVRERDAHLVAVTSAQATAIAEVAEVLSGKEQSYWNAARIDSVVRSNQSEAHLSCGDLHAKVNRYGTKLELRIPNANAAAAAAALIKIAEQFGEKVEG